MIMLMIRSKVNNFLEKSARLKGSQVTKPVGHSVDPNKQPRLKSYDFKVFHRVRIRPVAGVIEVKMQINR